MLRRQKQKAEQFGSGMRKPKSRAKERIVPYDDLCRSASHSVPVTHEDGRGADETDDGSVASSSGEENDEDNKNDSDDGDSSEDGDEQEVPKKQQTDTSKKKWQMRGNSSLRSGSRGVGSEYAAV